MLLEQLREAPTYASPIYLDRPNEECHKSWQHMGQRNENPIENAEMNTFILIN